MFTIRIWLCLALGLEPPGMYLAIAIAIVLVVLAFLPDMLRKAAEADARDAARRAEAENAAKCTENGGKNRQI